MSEVDQTIPRRAFDSRTFAAEGSEGRDQLRSELVIVERNAFFRDCLVGGLSASAPAGIVGLAGLAELDPALFDQRLVVALLSVLSLNEAEAEDEFGRLAEIGPRIPVVVLASSDDPDAAMAALGRGAKGFIAMDAGFDILIHVLRFVAAGAPMFRRNALRPRSNRHPPHPAPCRCMA